MILDYAYINKYRNKGVNETFVCYDCPRKSGWKWIYGFYANSNIVLTTWYRICNFVSQNPGCSRAEIRREISANDNDLFTTMIYDNLIRYERQGKKFKYYLTDKGASKMLRADAMGEQQKAALEKAATKRIIKANNIIKSRRLNKIKEL